MTGKKSVSKLLAIIVAFVMVFGVFMAPIGQSFGVYADTLENQEEAKNENVEEVGLESSENIDETTTEIEDTSSVEGVSLNEDNSGLSGIVDVIISRREIITKAPLGVVDTANITSWADLKTAIENEDATEVTISGNLGATETITIPAGRSVTIKGSGTIYQKAHESGDDSPYNTMFKVSDKNSVLTINSGVTLSGKLSTCSSGAEKQLTDFEAVITSYEPGDAEPEEHTKEEANPNAKTLDDFKKTEGTGYTGVIYGVYLRDAYGGKWLTNTDQNTGDVTFTIDEQGRIKVGNEFFQTSYQGARLITGEPSYPLYAHNSSGQPYSGSGAIYLYLSAISEYFIGDMSSGTIDEDGAKFTATMTSSGGGETYWMIPDPEDGDKEKKYTTEAAATTALEKYNAAKFPPITTTYYTVPGETSPEYSSKTDPALVAAMETYNEEHPKEIKKDGWSIPDPAGGPNKTFVKPEEQAQAQAALDEYNVANPPQQGCDGDNAECPTYDKNSFVEGTLGSPKGFFIQVDAGKAILNGGILENFNTSRSKGDTPRFVAPVVVIGEDSSFDVQKGAIKNNIVGYIVDDDVANQSADKIKAYVKGAAPNAQRTDKGVAIRRNSVAGIDDGDPGSGITGTAGAIIYAGGATGTVSGCDIGFNRGDTGGIFVTGDGSMVTLANGTDINNNVGVQFGGGTTVEDGGFIAMTGGKIQKNVAWFGGGAVYATENGTKWLLGEQNDIAARKDGWFTLDGGTLDGNTSFTRGGAILADSDGVSLIKGTLSNNMARMLGGAVYVMGDHPDFTYTVYIEKGYVHENKAVSAGYKGTVAKTASLPRYDKENNEKLAKKLVPPSGCTAPTELFDGDMDVNSDDLKDGYPNNQKFSTDGTGGGVWLCSYGNTTIDLSDESEFYIDNNTATGSLRDRPISAPDEGGDDFHKDTKNNGSLVITGVTDDDDWWDQNAEVKYTSPDGSLGIKDSGLRNLINNGDEAPAGYDKATYGTNTGVDVYGNLSRRGGGLAADGSFVFGKRNDTADIYAEMAIKKSWAAGTTPKDIAVKVFVETAEGKYEIATVPLTSTAKEASELDTVFEEGNYTGRLILPAYVEKTDGSGNPEDMVQVFDLTADGQNIDLNNVEHLAKLAAAIKDGGEVKLSSAGRKIVFEEYLITGYDDNGAPILEETDEFQLSPGKVSLGDLDAEIKTLTQKQTDGTNKEVVKASFSQVYFNTDLVNDQPAEIEKFVNEAVHKEIALDEIFTYDIVAYVRQDADKIVITDTLVDDLGFVSKATDVELYALDTNNHKITNDVTGARVNSDASVHGGSPINNEEVVEDGQVLKKVEIDGQNLKVTLANKLVFDTDGNYEKNADDDQLLTDLRGKWVRVSFKAQIKKALQDKIEACQMKVSDLKNVTVKADKKFKPENSIYGKDDNDEEIYRPTPNVGNDPLKADDDNPVKDDHSGIDNTASYSIEVGNEAAFEDESNTVTVKPQEPELEKYVNHAVHKDITLDEVFTYDILAYVTKDADSVTITDELVSDLEFVDPDTIEVGYIDGNNHKPEKDINGEVINDDASVAAAEVNPLKEGDDYTISTANNTLVVTLDDKVTVNHDTGAITREKHVVENLRGKWIKVTFMAQIKKSIQDEINTGTKSLSDLKNVSIKADENNPVLSDEAHNGIDNTARYEIGVANESKYKETSNTVTVKPEGPEIEKYINQAVHKDITLDEVFTYDIIAYITKDAEGVTITDTLHENLEFAMESTDDVEVVDLGTENNHKVTNNISAEQVNEDATVAEAGEKITPDGIVFGGPAFDGEGKVVEPAELTVNFMDVTSVPGVDKAHNLRGHWIRVRFTAKIREGLEPEILEESYDTVKAGEVYSDSISLGTRMLPRVGNEPVVSDEDHTGIPNTAFYTISIGNSVKYEDTSNTVTVKPELETIDIPVQKLWDERDVDLEKRPESVTFNLLANGEETGKTITLSGDNRWSGSFENLYTKDEDGNEIEYTVTEDSVEYYYYDEYELVDETYTITNHRRPWTPRIPSTPGNVGQFTVAKTVTGSAEKNKAYDIKVKFTYSDGSTYTHKISLKPTDNAYKFDYVPADTKVEISEETTGYTMTCTVDGKRATDFNVKVGSDNEVVINNHKEPKNPDKPKTGDDTSFVPWIALLILSALLTGAMAYRKKGSRK